MTDFDDLLAKAEAVIARPGVLDALKASPEVVSYIAAASPDVIRALVLRLREAERALRRARDQMDAMVAGPDGFTTIYPDPKLEVEVIDAYFDTAEGGE